MTKIIYLIPVVFLFTLSLKAQEKNTISLSYGVNSGLLKDLNFSPLHYKETGHLFSLQYLRHNPNKRNIIDVAIDFSSGKIKNHTSTFLTSNYIFGKINASYSRKIKTSNSDKYNFYAGSGYATNLLYFEWNDNEAFSYAAAHGLVLNFIADYSLNNLNQVYSIFSIPFLQLLARPPYNGRDEFIIENENSPAKILFNGKLATFNKYYGFSWSTKYIFHVSKKIDLSLNYSLNLQKVTGVNQLTHLQNHLQTGLNFRI